MIKLGSFYDLTDSGDIFDELDHKMKEAHPEYEQHWDKVDSMISDLTTLVLTGKRPADFSPLKIQNDISDTIVDICTVCKVFYLNQGFSTGVKFMTEQLGNCSLSPTLENETKLIKEKAREALRIISKLCSSDNYIKANKEVQTSLWKAAEALTECL